jgi:tight adherence protein B
MIVALLVAGAVFVLWPTRLTVLTVRRRRDHAAVLRALAAQDPRRTALGSIVLVAGLALLVGGPVAAVLGAVYTALAGRALLRRAARRTAAGRRAAALDHLAALAADLRAGLVTTAAGAVAAVTGTTPAGSSSRTTSAGGGVARSGVSSDGRVAVLTGSVWRLAERTGAPAADLVERLEADARAADRAAASAAAQAAGAQATALLLAGLPIGGIGLGVAIGADPVHVLLHTRIGAACAIVAVLLQAAGLLWAERLAR